MSIKVVLFDLDGTLLPMDQDLFVKSYFGLLAKKLAPYGYETEKLIPAIWQGTGAMVKNDGTKKNEEAFWKAFSAIFGDKVMDDLPVFDEFYQKEFAGAKEACGVNPKAAEVIGLLKEKGMRCALATNPIFPAVATENRIRWAGLSPDDFEFYTTYETCRYCKPNPKYYEDIVEKLGVKAEECLMVGNDVTEDMIAESLGMQVFLLTDCII
ncbi:MAG: HAD family hydrolase, partial [Lachnospiraceae bacterium]|nr:HAD family hydrolase [Lachnospiraceae bacterium]